MTLGAFEVGREGRKEAAKQRLCIDRRRPRAQEAKRPPCISSAGGIPWMSHFFLFLEYVSGLTTPSLLFSSPFFQQICRALQLRAGERNEILELCQPPPLLTSSSSESGCGTGRTSGSEVPPTGEGSKVPREGEGPAIPSSSRYRRCCEKADRYDSVEWKLSRLGGGAAGDGDGASDGVRGGKVMNLATFRSMDDPMGPAMQIGRAHV